jgi:arabinose-5-phosphate isomerase
VSASKIEALPGTPAVDREHPTREALLSVARDTFQTEGEALLRFGAALDGRFVDAVELLLSARGRVVVTGIGKSGHIGRKIAATLASTGTPAHFVHAGEASHGDLGMVGLEDVVIALSNSGETSELTDIVAFALDHNIPLIAVTGNANSTLACQAAVALVLPPMTEACPNGLAPTTSTTAMAALGDALAIAAMTAKGTTPAEFRRFHPGGRLGVHLLKVGELMHAGDTLPVVAPDTPMRETILTISEKGFGVAIVRDPKSGSLGIITDGDMRRHVEILWHSHAGDIANASPVTIAAEAYAREAVELMGARRITSLIVVDEAGDLAGLIHMHDCVRAGLTAP